MSETEFYKKHRPTRFKGLLGQQDAAATLLALQKGESGFPHAILLSGPSGCGKTTLARIVRQKLQCADMDFREMNSSDDRGIDAIRKLRDMLGLAPMGGPCRVIVLDEAHQLTSEAQDALLKMLEDTPKHVYFMLCTTDPNKLKQAIRTRCTEIALKSVGVEDLLALCGEVCEAEGLTLDQSVLDAVAQAADGSPRKALVVLQQVAGVEDVETQLSIARNSNSKEVSENIGRLLHNINGPVDWAVLAGELSKVTWSEAEGVRRMVLGYARAILLKQKSASAIANRAFLIISCFHRNYYDSGNAGLIGSCWDVYLESTKGAKR